MTPEWYRAHGYELSSYIEQSVIDRAEADVTAAYVDPILGTAEAGQFTREAVIGNLAFLLILQRGIFATRAGAKVKTTVNSMQSDAWAQIQQEAASCHLWLTQLAKVDGAANGEVTDICKIYFKSNFLYL